MKPWQVEEWCIPPAASCEFVAAMEDVLDVYKRPYDPSHPVVCFDEMPYQLVEESRPGLPAQPGRPEKVDYEYRRRGVVDVFMMVEPLKGRRHVKVMDQRKRTDFAQCIRELVDVHYPQAERIVLVLDNLNTHTSGSLYEAFEPAEARRLARKLEIHYTPKHGSWLNIAEIELRILSGQCLRRRMGKKEDVVREIAAWEERRNGTNQGVDWQFTTTDARIRLRSLYPRSHQN